MTPSLRDRMLGFWWRRKWRGYLTLRALLPQGPDGDYLLYTTRYGSQFLLDPISYIDGHVVAEGYYESEVFEALRPGLRAGAVLWDIGANFGLHAVTAARLMAGLTVAAFEPNPAEHARLLRHRKWNAPHLITSSLALSDGTAVLPLQLGPTGNSGMTTLAPWSQATYGGSVLVATAMGDDLIARGVLPSPTVIKLDVEGHEAAVLRGLAGTLAQPGCRLIVFEDAASAETPVKDLLRAAGFSIAPLSRREKTSHGLANFVAQKPPVS